MPKLPRIGWSRLIIGLERWCRFLRTDTDRSRRRCSRRADSSITAYSVAPLFRHLAMHHIERDELATDDPLLFRELQGRCTLCRSRTRCAQDLARKSERNALRALQDYCPNAAKLNVLVLRRNRDYLRQRTTVTVHGASATTCEDTLPR